MKLINLKTGDVFLSCESGQLPQFSDPAFQQAMSDFGIIIPDGMLSFFGGKKRVYLDDPEFLSAFKELYFQYEMPPNTYVWR